MVFEERDELAQSGQIDQLPPVAVEKNLLVATEPVATFDEPHGGTGWNTVTVFPAFYGGRRAWLVRREWNSDPGYSCSGLTEEEVIPFYKGVRLLISAGAYQHLFENPVVA